MCILTGLRRWAGFVWPLMYGGDLSTTDGRSWNLSTDYILVFGLTDMFEVYQLTAVLFLTRVLVSLSILVCRFYVSRPKL